MASLHAGIQQVGKFTPNLTRIDSQDTTPKRKPISVVKKPGCCRFLTSAHLMSRIPNRLGDHGRCQPLERTYPPGDLLEKPDFGRNSHVHLPLFHNLQWDSETERCQNLCNCSQRSQPRQ